MRRERSERCRGAAGATAHDPRDRPQAGVFAGRPRIAFENPRNGSAAVPAGPQRHLGIHRRLRHRDADDRVRRSAVRHRQRARVVERWESDLVHAQVRRPAGGAPDETGPGAAAVEPAAGAAGRELLAGVGARRAVRVRARRRPATVDRSPTCRARASIATSTSCVSASPRQTHRQFPRRRRPGTDDSRRVSQTGGAVAFVRGATSNPTSLPDPPEPEVWIVGTAGGTAQRLGPGTGAAILDDDRRCSGRPQARPRASLTWSVGNAVSVASRDVTPAIADERRAGAARHVVARRQEGRESPQRRASASTTSRRRRRGRCRVRPAASPTMLWSPDSRYLAFRKNATGRAGSGGIDGYRFNGVPVAAIRSRSGSWTSRHRRRSQRSSRRSPGMGSVQSGAMFWSDDHRARVPVGRRRLAALLLGAGDRWCATLMTRGDGDVEFVEQSLDRKSSHHHEQHRRPRPPPHLHRGLQRRHDRDRPAGRGEPVVAGAAGGRPARLPRSHACAAADRDDSRSRRHDGCRRDSRAYLRPTLRLKLVEPMLVEYPATDGKTAFGQLFVPAQAERLRRHLRARRHPAADAARLSLHGRLHASVRDEPVSRQPRLRRALSRVPQQHHARLRVPERARLGARRRQRNARRRRRREIPDGARGRGLRRAASAFTDCRGAATSPRRRWRAIRTSSRVGFDMAGVHTSDDAARRAAFGDGVARSTGSRRSSSRRATTTAMSCSARGSSSRASSWRSARSVRARATRVSRTRRTTCI